MALLQRTIQGGAGGSDLQWGRPGAARGAPGMMREVGFGSGLNLLDFLLLACWGRCAFGSGPSLLALLQLLPPVASCLQAQFLCSSVSYHSQVSWQELNRKQMDPVQAAGRTAQEAQMVALRRPSLDWQAPLAPALVEAEVELTPYVNTSAFKV